MLDVGCGTGRMAVPLTGYLSDEEYEGFDLMPEAIERCQENITPDILSSTFTHMLPDEVPNYLSEIERVMKPGGRAMITFFLLNRQSLKLIEAGKSAIGFKYHFGVYRIKEKSTPETAIAY